MYALPEHAVPAKMAVFGCLFASLCVCLFASLSAKPNPADHHLSILMGVEPPECKGYPQDVTVTNSSPLPPLDSQLSLNPVTPLSLPVSGSVSQSPSCLLDEVPTKCTQAWQLKLNPSPFQWSPRMGFHMWLEYLKAHPKKTQRHTFFPHCERQILNTT